MAREVQYWFASASFSGPLLSVSVEFCWFASASFSGPLLSHSVEFCGFVGSRALSFSGPLLSVSVEFCLWVCLFVRNFEVKYLGNQRS